MRPQNKKKSTLDNWDGYDKIMLNLVGKNINLANIGTFFEKTIQKHTGNSKNLERTSEEQNIINWYNENNKGYPKLWGSKRKFQIRDIRDLKIKNEIENIDYSGLNNILETMLVNILIPILKESQPQSTVFKTSSSDDINAGIDAIAQIGVGPNAKYVGIDFCVSSDKNRIQEKADKRYTTNPKEFQYYSGYTDPIPRIVKDFNPDVISHLFHHYLIQIQAGQDPNRNIETIYQDIKNFLIERKGEEAINTQNTMKATIEEILT